MRKFKLSNKTIIGILLSVFVFYSLFVLFKQNSKISKIREQYEIELNNSHDKIEFLNATLRENFNQNGKELAIQDDFHEQLLKKEKLVAVLFLEKNACSDCYIETVRKIIYRLGCLDPFLIVSHKNNLSIIEEAKMEEQISDSKIVWTNEDIYHNSISFTNNSALLIIDNNLTVRWVLPLEFINDKLFFNEYISFLERNL
ncbi:MAG: hypothetical protein KGZ97_04505 [Bacteroidetes bacterium]|nr:hypothetical protein [Bacteroidota bacterium]